MKLGMTFLFFLLFFGLRVEAIEHDRLLEHCYFNKKIKTGLLCVIKPSTTDSKISDLKKEGKGIRKILGFGYHVIGIPNNVSKSSQLHLHLGGSYGKPYRKFFGKIMNEKFISEGMRNGRIVINLAYDNKYSVNQDNCKKLGMEIDNCAGKIRQEKQTGTDLISLVNTTVHDSINYRFYALLRYLKFQINLPINPDVSWNSIGLSGHSQGGGQALFIAKNYGSQYACLIAGGYDVGDNINPSRLNVADWIIQPNSKTDPKKIYGVVHKEDTYYRAFVETYKLLGLNNDENMFEYNYKVKTQREAHGSIVNRLSQEHFKNCFGARKKQSAI